MTAGSLVIVGTPIGNLADLSPRGAEALRTADVICCEDTRRTGLLLKHLGSDRKPYIVINEHSEFAEVGRVIELIQSGSTVALVSDAGMPLVSDPGEILVGEALGQGCEVDVIPGPTAISTALALSGLSTRRFVFEGFLPRRGRDRRRILTQIAVEERTVVFYESPHRVGKTLADLVQECEPERGTAVLRELTKLHQETWRGTLASAVEHHTDSPGRGEYVVVLGPAERAEVTWTDEALASELDVLVRSGQSKRDAVAAVVEETGVAKRRVYEIANRGSD